MILKTLDQVRHLAFVYRVGTHFKIGTCGERLGMKSKRRQEKQDKDSYFFHNQNPVRAIGLNG
jgi:hypothetical protein